MSDDILREAEFTLLLEQIKRRGQEPDVIQLMARVFGMSPEEYYRHKVEGPTQEEQDRYDKNAVEFEKHIGMTPRIDPS